MATWDEVVAHARSNWSITGETDHAVAIEFSTGGGRTQMTSIQLFDKGTEHRIRLETSFAREGDIDPAAALKMNADLPLGAIAVNDVGRLTLMYSMMLSTLNTVGIDSAIKTLAVLGDQLEQRLSGGDRY